MQSVNHILRRWCIRFKTHDDNGAFTNALKNVWKNSAFSGNYNTFHKEIASLKYSYSSSPSRYYNMEKIPPYSVYYGYIDYAFETPPETIRVNVFSQKLTRKCLGEEW